MGLRSIILAILNSARGFSVRQIQKLLVASAALAAGVALSADGAAAQGLFGGGLGYVKGFGGATWPQNDNSELDIRGVGTLIPELGARLRHWLCPRHCRWLLHQA